MTLPGTLTSMGSYAFNGCTALTALTIREGVTAISNYAFRNCSSMQALTLPNSMQKLGSYSFYNCDGLSKVNFGRGLNTIGISDHSYTFFDTSYCMQKADIPRYTAARASRA